MDILSALRKVVTNIKDWVNEKLKHKVDAVEGKGLSTNDLTDELVEKINSSERAISELDVYVGDIPNDSQASTITGYVDEQRDLLIDGMSAYSEGVAMMFRMHKNRIDSIVDGTQVVGKATQDSNGNVITDTYETKADANDKLAEAKQHAETLDRKMGNRVKAIESDCLKKVDKTELQNQITDNKAALDVLKGAGEGSIAKTFDDKINEFATRVTNDGVVNTYKELVDYAATHSSDFVELVGEVDKNTMAIEENKTAITNVNTRIDNSKFMTVVSLPLSNWIGETKLFSQVVNIEGVTATSKVDLQPTPEQLIELQDIESTLMAVNDNGIVTVYALHTKPEVDYTMSAVITEVVAV
jgi:hypothetical protein